MIGLVLIMLAFVFPRQMIVSGSMAPTIAPGTTVWASRASYLFAGPKRGDIVVFKPTAEVSPDTPWAHRVVAVPGDRVLIRDRTMYVNGMPTQFPHVDELDREEFTVPAGYYLQKGDDPDSITGLVKANLVRSKIVGL